MSPQLQAMEAFLSPLFFVSREKLQPPSSLDSKKQMQTFAHQGREGICVGTQWDMQSGTQCGHRTGSWFPSGDPHDGISELFCRKKTPPNGRGF